MNGPNPVLMHYYGNEELYQKKLSGAAERLSAKFLAKVPPSLEGVAAKGPAPSKARKLVEGLLNSESDALFHHDAHGSMDLEEGLTHLNTRAPLRKRKQAAVPEGMVRLASIVAQTGVDMAKKAGIVGAIATSPLTRKALTVGAIGGAGLLAVKGLRKTQQAMGAESGPQTFGPGRFGFNPAFGVNSYGQAAPGTPLV